MATFRDLLSAAKSSIAEIDTTTAAERIAGGSLVLDVREPDEYAEGAIAGAIHIPRGHLESQIEGRGSPTRTHPSSCTAPAACGRRSPCRRCRSSATPAPSRWTADSGAGRTKDGRGSSRRRSPPSRTTGTSATCCSPRSASPARSSCSSRRCSCSVPAASARPPRCTSPPPASARSASSTWTRSTPRTCSARSSTTSTASVIARSTRRRRR